MTEKFKNLVNEYQMQDLTLDQIESKVRMYLCSSNGQAVQSEDITYEDVSLICGFEPAESWMLARTKKLEIVNEVISSSDKPSKRYFWDKIVRGAI
jgi:hypothetical protein